MHDNTLIFHTAAFLVQCSTETRVRLTESPPTSRKKLPFHSRGLRPFKQRLHMRLGQRLRGFGYNIGKANRHEFP